jgi:beta propeller repeat protein
MTRRFWVGAITMSLSLATVIRAAVGGTITQLSYGSATDQQIAAAVSGTHVVWTNESTPSNFDIVLMDLASGAPAVNLTNTPDEQEFLADIDGANVVYTHTWQNHPGDIVIYDTSLGVASVVASSSQSLAFQEPTIRGPYVAFVTVSTQLDIALYDTRSGQGIQVTNDSAQHARPRLGNDMVVYEVYANAGDNGDVFGYRISTSGPPFPIATGPARQISPDIDGHTVIWVESVSGVDQVFARDLNTNVTTQLTTASSSKIQPRISGNRIVWSDDRQGNLDLYTYDLGTGLEEPLVEGPGDQLLADIDGNRVVYTSNASGFEQIYLITPPTLVYTATAQPPINPNGSSVFNVKRGVVPVKFALAVNGAPTCQLPAATITLSRIAGGALGSINEADFVQPSDVGSDFRIDPSACQYVYNLGASSLGPGTYKVQIAIGGTTVGNGQFSLK